MRPTNNDFSLARAYVIDLLSQLAQEEMASGQKKKGKTPYHGYESPFWHQRTSSEKSV
jgi:hypothetical protein